MGLTDQGLHPEIFDNYRIETVDPSRSASSPRHIGLTAELCILCRACEDACPWECIFMLSRAVITDAETPEVLAGGAAAESQNDTRVVTGGVG